MLDYFDLIAFAFGFAGGIAAAYLVTDFFKDAARCTTE